MRSPALRLGHLARRPRRVLGPAVAALEAALGDQLVVKMLHREVKAPRLEQLDHPGHLLGRRAPRRRPRNDPGSEKTCSPIRPANPPLPRDSADSPDTAPKYPRTS